MRNLEIVFTFRYIYMCIYHLIKYVHITLYIILLSIYIYIYIYHLKITTTSLSYRAPCTNFPEPLSPFISIVLRSRQVFQATSCISTESL